MERSNHVLVQHDEEHRLTSRGHDFPFAPHLFLDSSVLDPERAAIRIAQHFDLPSTGDES